MAGKGDVKKKTKKKETVRKLTKKEMEKRKKEKTKHIKEFSKEVLEEFGHLVKSIVVFGSMTRDQFHSKSDVDLIVIIDDTKGEISEARREMMDAFLRKTAKNIDEDLSPQPVWTITEFWEMVRTLSPLAYTILKEGKVVYDTGFFKPVQNLLAKGRLPATREAAEKRMEAAEPKIKKVKNIKLWMVAEDLYLAMLNSTQAAIMFMGGEPPSSHHIVDKAREFLVENKLLDEKYLKWLDDVIKFRKGVEHREIKDITGEELDNFIKRAEEYVKEMEKVIKKIELGRRINDVQKSYEVMIKASVAALKSMDKLPPDPKDLPKAFKKHLIEGGVVDPVYEEVFAKVLELKKRLNERTVHEVPEREISLTKEYVRRFVGEIRRYFK
ncbi:MAG: hypothetical protein DRP11_04170, partial [Candidatus Aenigmatarchaeota archaeon]